jgi:hypothetical protein
MSGAGGGGGEAAQVVAASSGVNISTIPPDVHLFFDDDPVNIRSVNKAVSEYNKKHTETPILLRSIHCPPKNLSLKSNDGTTDVMVTDISHYNELKTSTELLDDKLKGNILTYPNKGCGKGLTLEMIEQIIEFESIPEQSKVRKYLFDFDGLISQVQGITFFPRIAETGPHIPGYATYLFSDHIGQEPERESGRGRFNQLKLMFELIGRERVYIITNNDSARISKSNPVPGRPYFVQLVKELLPDFIDIHLKKTMMDEHKLPDKGLTIVTLLGHKSSEGGKRYNSRKTNRRRKSSSSSSSRYKRRRYSKKSKK